MLALALVLLLLLIVAPSARADSIVYVNDHDVWAATPDGARRQAITTDGSASSPYTSPSQARDGTIVAQRGLRFHRLSPSGRPLAAFDAGAIPAGDPDVSPDGTKLAYWHTTFCGLSLCSRTLFSYADRYTPPESLDDGAGDLIEPSWIDDTHVVVANQSNVYIDELGPVQERLWFYDPAFTQVNDADVAGDRLAAVAGSNWEYLVVYTLPAPPPALPERACVWRADPGEGRFDDPTWAPDGSALAFGLSDGVHVMTGLRDLSDCTRLNGSLVLPGGSTPDWGPSDLHAPEPAPTPAPVATPQPAPRDERPPRLTATAPARITLRALTRKGLVVTLSSDERVSGTATLRFTRSVRRRYRLRPGYATRFSLERSSQVALRLPRAAARRLAKARRTRMTVVVSATDRAGNHTTLNVRTVQVTR